MPIPYRDADDLDEFGTVAYLKIEPLPHNAGYLGALFLINARGEPLEFTYNRIDTPQTFLWRQDDLQRHAARKLTASLFSLCPRTPSLLFCQDIQVPIPVCRIVPAGEAIPSSRDETQDTVHTSEPLQVFWFPGKPAEDSLELRLLQLLAS